jgi:hypothetical protein
MSFCSSDLPKALQRARQEAVTIGVLCTRQTLAGLNLTWLLPVSDSEQMPVELVDIVKRTEQKERKEAHARQLEEATSSAATTAKAGAAKSDEMLTNVIDE